MTRDRRNSWAVGLFATFLIGMISGGFIYFSFWAGGAVARSACDNAVHTMMTTQSWIELRRSIFIIRYLDCRLSSRL